MLYPKELEEKALGVIIRVEQNKPKFERLFGAIYLKIVLVVLVVTHLKMFTV